MQSGLSNSTTKTIMAEHGDCIERHGQVYMTTDIEESCWAT